MRSCQSVRDSGPSWMPADAVGVRPQRRAGTGHMGSIFQREREVLLCEGSVRQVARRNTALKRGTDGTQLRSGRAYIKHQRHAYTINPGAHRGGCLHGHQASFCLVLDG